MMTLNEVTQRRLERYQEHILVAGEQVKSAAAYNRIIVEAAVGAGIAEGVPADLLDLSPRTVAELTERVITHVREALEPLSGEA